MLNARGSNSHFWPLLNKINDYLQVILVFGQFLLKPSEVLGLHGFPEFPQSIQCGEDYRLHPRK